MIQDPIRYDEKGVWVNGKFRECENPRLEFAKELANIPDDTYWKLTYDSWILSNTFFQGRHIVGKGCIIGGSGFGYEREESGRLVNIPHRGNVIIEKDVVIHNNVCIDRAVIGNTIIGEGTKIDNLVHVAHGCKIGKHCLIVAGTVLGGSCVIGDSCFIGINASIKNKVKIGNNVIVGMGAIITKDVPDGVTVIGINKIL